MELNDPMTLPVLAELITSGTDEEKAAAKAAISEITKERIK